MGTRNLTAVINKEGELIVKQYGQWDGYPKGVGLDVLKFLTTEDNISKLESQLKNVAMIKDNEEYEKFINNMDKTEYNLWESTFGTRDLSAEVLTNIANNVEDKTINLIHYKGWDLIEWSWVINFQTNRLECYDGDFTCNEMLTSFNLENLPEEEDFLFCFEPDKDFQTNGYKIRKCPSGKWRVKKGRIVLEEFTNKCNARTFARNN